MLIDLYSRRKRQQENAGKADVYQYSKIPKVLRVQLQQILEEAIGPHHSRGGYSSDHYIRDNASAWNFIAKTLRREYGVHKLAKAMTEGEEVLNFLMVASVEQVIDVVELATRYLFRAAIGWSDHDRKQRGAKQEAAAAIAEINQRFKQTGVGFQFLEGTVVQLDSDFAHEELIRPALTLLRDERLRGPQAEFLNAHRHYRNGDLKEAITEAAKSFESMLKAICDIKGWGYDRGERASDLLKRVKREGLWPDYLDNSFDQLVATLSSGLPKVRNEDGAHGQGGEIKVVPSYVAAYALQLAAAKIIMLGEAARL